jgi:hypothetical protein
MNVELYSYSLFTTVLGMLVVFLSLSALSLMMVVLKRIFSAEGEPGRRVEQRKAGSQAGAQGPSSRSMPGWVPIAVAAYLAEESEAEPERPSADPWNAVTNHFDPWISANRNSKRGV